MHKKKKKEKNINNNKNKMHVTCVKQVKIVKTRRRKTLLS